MVIGEGIPIKLDVGEKTIKEIRGMVG